MFDGRACLLPLGILRVGSLAVVCFFSFSFVSKTKLICGPNDGSPVDRWGWALDDGVNLIVLHLNYFFL